MIWSPIYWSRAAPRDIHDKISVAASLPTTSAGLPGFPRQLAPTRGVFFVRNLLVEWQHAWEAEWSVISP